MKDHDDVQRSSVTGKIIKLKVKKSTQDKEVYTIKLMSSFIIITFLFLPYREI